MSIYIDSRGKGEKAIASILKVKKLPVEMRVLDSADYVIGERGIERKTCRDLLSSVTSGDRHLWNQLETLKNTYTKPLVMVEGTLEERKIQNSIYKAITIGWGIPIFFSNNLHDSADCLENIYDKYVSGKKSSGPPPPVVIKEVKPEKVRWAMLQCVQGVGTEIATRIITKFPHIISVAENPQEFKEMLETIEGLRKETINIMVKVFCNA